MKERTTYPGDMYTACFPCGPAEYCEIATSQKIESKTKKNDKNNNKTV